MEQALKGAETDSSGNVSPPDVIRSAINKDDSGREIVKGTPAGASTKIIDNLFGVPDKIVIPERYIPETVSWHMPYPKSTKHVINSCVISGHGPSDS